MDLTIANILDIRQYIEAICVANAVILMIALNELGDDTKIRELTDHVILASKGDIRVRDQSARNSLKKLVDLGFVQQLEEKKGERTVYLFNLTDCGKRIIEALRTFVEEIRNQLSS